MGSPSIAFLIEPNG
jgi:hypothetical protein